MQIVSICMKYKSLFFWENIINLSSLEVLSSAESAQIVVIVKECELSLTDNSHEMSKSIFTQQ